MSKYTTTIRNLLQNNFDLGLQSYPIYNENHRQTLNKNILNYYCDDEIAFETAELFKFYLNTKMNIIMPKYNALYETYEKVKNKLLDNLNSKEEGTNNKQEILTYKGNSSSNGSTNSTNKSKEIFQDTPQGKIYNDTIDNIHWVTNATLNDSESNQNANSTLDANSASNDNTDTNYTKIITGNDGKKYNIDILKDIENNYNSIDMLIINELEDLFFGLM